MTARKAGSPARLLVPTEADELRMLGQWLDAMGLIWCHVRNEGRPTSRNQVGVKPGVPDVLIFTPAPSIGLTCRGVAIELKRREGGRMSVAQREWSDKLRGCGWTVLFCRGVDEAIEHLLALGYFRVAGGEDRVRFFRGRPGGERS
jgi:hypothetical protein